MTTFSTGDIGGSASGTAVAFPSSYQVVDLYLAPHPNNKMPVYVMSQNGGLGWPMPTGSAPLIITNVDNVGSLQGWFSFVGDKICYMIIDRSP